MQFKRNTSLRDEIKRNPKLAAQIKRRYPDRFEKLAGPQPKKPEAK